MPEYKPSIVNNVQRSIGAVNHIVVSLQRDAPLSSDLLTLNYPPSAVQEFYEYTQIIEDSLRAASATAATWLRETGDRLSQNMDQARQVEDSIRERSTSLGCTDAHTRATEERIRVLESDIQNGEANLSSAQRSLENARKELVRQGKARNIMRIGAIAALFFEPIIFIGLTAIDIIALRDAVREQKDVISTIEVQLSASQLQLKLQRESLAIEQVERTRLSAGMAEMMQHKAVLAADARILELARADLAALSVLINDCLHTVNTALSSSTTIGTISSMRNVVTGIRGIVDTLGANAMFAGSLAKLDDAAFTSLERGVASIRRHRLMV